MNNSAERIAAGIAAGTMIFVAITTGFVPAAAEEGTIRPLLQNVAPSTLKDLAPETAPQRSDLRDIIRDPSQPLVLSTSTASIGITLPFAEQAKPVLQERHIVFDNGNNSRTIPLPKNDGSIQIITVIDSEDAPTEFRYPLELPEGTSVVSAKGGLFFYGSDRSFLGGLAEPWATDSNGNAVSTTYTLEGSTVVQTIEHNANDTSYPIVADPWIGVDLIDSVGLRNVSEGYIVDVVPTGWGRTMNGLPVHFAHVDELRTKLGGNSWALTNTIEQQFLCHVAFNYFEQGTYNMESWRREVPWGEQAFSQCNP